MRIGQISDLHIGITTEGQIKQQLRAMAKDNPDVIVNCGDNTGTTSGYKCTKQIVRLIRQFFPETPILWTNGNHDYWCTSKVKENGRYYKTRPSPIDFYKNLNMIEECLKEANIHFLDKDGIYSHPDFSDVLFIGSSGWYAHPNPPTNDINYLPYSLDGDTHRSLIKQTEDNLFNTEAKLQTIYQKDYHTVIFVSHFPVIKAGIDYKGRFEDFSWRTHIGDFFQENYNCKHFLCGHAHQLHEGPLRYECGPDYYKPAYQIIEV